MEDLQQQGGFDAQDEFKRAEVLSCRVNALGAERLLYCRMGGEALIVRTDESLSSAPTLGATIYVTPKRDRLHWFDADSGQRLP